MLVGRVSASSRGAASVVALAAIYAGDLLLTSAWAAGVDGHADPGRTGRAADLSGIHRDGVVLRRPSDEARRSI